jgi:hypothetical protein
MVTNLVISRLLGSSWLSDYRVPTGIMRSRFTAASSALAHYRNALVVPLHANMCSAVVRCTSVVKLGAAAARRCTLWAGQNQLPQQYLPVRRPQRLQ